MISRSRSRGRIGNLAPSGYAVAARASNAGRAVRPVNFPDSALANKGSFDAAARELEHFLKLKPEAPEGERVREYLDEWEKKGLIKVAGGQ